MHYDMQIVSWP